MKRTIVIILTILTILAMIAGNYFSEKVPQYNQKLSELTKVHDSGAVIAKTNSWIVNSVILKIDNIENFQNAQSYIMGIEENLKENLNTTLIKLDKKQKGFIVISLKSKIYRNDISNLLKLFKLDVSNGYVRINSFSVESDYIITNFDLIKFYKD